MRVWACSVRSSVTRRKRRSTSSATTSPSTHRYLIDAGQVNVQVGICPVKPAVQVYCSSSASVNGTVEDSSKKSDSIDCNPLCA